MGKTIILSLLICFLHYTAYSNIQIGTTSYPDSSELKRDLVINIAKSFHGIKEVGKNEGFTNKEFEKAMRNVGWKTGQAWCSYVVKLIYQLAEVTTNITGWSPSSYNRKDPVYTGGKFIKKPKPADCVSFTYPKFLSNKSRYKGIGHTGILMEIRPNGLVTAEGNTSDLSLQVVRDGDVYTANKIRPLNSNINISRWVQD